MSKNNYDEETVALEALFLEKHELALERKRLIETRTKLEKLRSEIETKAIDEMKIKEAKEIVELKKRKNNIDDIDDKNVNVRVLCQGTKSICSNRWIGYKLSFNILLPEITLYQEEMDIEILDEQNGNITIVDRYAYPKFETTKNFTGFSSSTTISDTSLQGKMYGRVSNCYIENSDKYPSYNHPYRNIWIQFVEKTDIGMLLLKQKNDGPKWEKLIKIIAQKISDEMDISRLPVSFRYMKKIDV